MIATSEIRKNDYYRYLCALLASNDTRESLFAIYAFENEVSKIKYVTSEPMAGYIRLQWWRDAINEIYQQEPKIHKSHITTALYKFVQTAKPDKQVFDEIIDQYENDIDFTEFKDTSELEKHAKHTSGNIFKLAMLTTNTESDNTKEAGIAFSLTEMMRKTRYNARYNRILFPANMMNNCQITADEILLGKNIERTKPIVKELCNLAKNNLQSVTERKPSKSEANMLLPLTVSKIFLKRIIKNDYDLFNKDIEGAPLIIQLALLKNSIFNRI